MCKLVVFICAITRGCAFVGGVVCVILIIIIIMKVLA